MLEQESVSPFLTVGPLESQVGVEQPREELLGSGTAKPLELCLGTLPIPGAADPGGSERLVKIPGPARPLAVLDHRGRNPQPPQRPSDLGQQRDRPLTATHQLVELSQRLRRVARGDRVGDLPHRLPLPASDNVPRERLIDRSTRVAIQGQLRDFSIEHPDLFAEHLDQGISSRGG